MRRSTVSAFVATALLLTPAPVAAHEFRVVRARVLDSAGGAPLAGAVVAVLDAGAGADVTVRPSGVLQIRVPHRRVRLVAVHVGFRADTVYLPPDSSAAEFRLAAAPLAMDPIVISGERSFTGASSGVMRALDLQIRPRQSSQELLRLVPGLVIARHAGCGKAEQIFLRGFDVDHGTDLAVSVDGTPVNMVSHAHGQGYADLHALGG